MKFNKEYTEYWEAAVSRSIDGTVIAGEQQVKHFLKLLGINNVQKVLDLGSSFGRMYPVLAEFGENIYGCEPDPFAIERCKDYPYVEVKNGTGENTGYENEIFDLIFCWAVFELVDHIRGLIEFNRILKTGGFALISGKNSNYQQDDELGLRAEIGAFRKNFPHRFTRLDQMVNHLEDFGFEICKLLVFPRRGDFGLLNYIDMTNSHKLEFVGYEYLLLITKSKSELSSQVSTLNLESKISDAASTKAEIEGYESAQKYLSTFRID